MLLLIFPYPFLLTISLYMFNNNAKRSLSSLKSVDLYALSTTLSSSLCASNNLGFIGLGFLVANGEPYNSAKVPPSSSRSEERRVGIECIYHCKPYRY